MVTPGTRWTISGSAAAGIASICFFVMTEVAAAASSRGSGTRAVTTISSRATCRERKSRKMAGVISLGVILAESSLPRAVLLRVVRAVLLAPLLDGAPPRLVLAVPAHGALQGLVEVGVA